LTNGPLIKNSTNADMIPQPIPQPKEFAASCPVNADMIPHHAELPKAW
jgi:hypothetical protein